jgi:hypothetical protein
MTLIIGGARVNHQQWTFFITKPSPNITTVTNLLGVYDILESWRLYFMRHVTSELNPTLLSSRHKTSIGDHERLCDLAKCTFRWPDTEPLLIFFVVLFGSARQKRVSISNRPAALPFKSIPLIFHHSLYHSTLYSLGTASLNNLKSICKYRITKYMQQELHTSGTAGSHSDVCSWNTNMFQLFSTKNAKRTPPWHKLVTLTNATTANSLRLVVRKNWHHGSWILTRSLAELRNKQNVSLNQFR